LLALVSKDPLASDLEHVAQQLADAFGARMCVVTDGSRGSSLALGKKFLPADAPKISAVRVPVYSGVTQKDATGAGDAFFGGVIASIHAWGMPNSADSLTRVGRIAAASGAACVEVLGALPVAKVSPSRIVSLCSEAHALVAAAAELDSAAHHADVGAAGGAAGQQKESNVFDAWLNSLLKDGDAVSDAASHYTLNIATATDNVNNLVNAIKSASSSGAKSAHIYTTGIGKSGAVAARLALSLRSIGLRASFVQGAEWVHGDLGAAGLDDVVIAFSHSGRTAELVDAAARLKARGAKVFSVTNDNSSPLSRASVAHFRAPAPGELLDAVPTRSVVSQEGIANAILSATATAMGLTKERFKEFHPGGSIGAKK
jgi:D-arabinose 5-phosphate isomerase GutQ